MIEGFHRHIVLSQQIILFLLYFVFFLCVFVLHLCICEFMYLCAGLVNGPALLSLTSVDWNELD